MILALIGSIILIISLGEHNTGPAIVGGIMIVLGLLIFIGSCDDLKARTNRTRYWAYGEEPDWKRRRR